MRWTVHGERAIYESEWLRLVLVDVEVPGHERFEHHVVRMPNQAAGAVIHDPQRGVLLLHRHRFITDTWGWEIPAGRIDPGESAVAAASREAREETGWRPGLLRPLVAYQPTNGLSDQVFNIFLADHATYEGDPSDPGESDRIEWVPLDDVRRLITTGQIADGLSLTALCYALATAAL